jgi:hypothetical protein
MSATGHAPRSPFASSSWEPRFVIEHFDNASLGHAVELWRRCSELELSFPADASIRYVAREPACLRVAHPHAHASTRAPWTALERPIVAADVPALVRTWLETATYPEEPWFDGGEARGYCVYWSYFGSEDGDDGRALVVIPKWFEIHK